MTLPRSMYHYADQTVRSPSGSFELRSVERTLTLRDAAERWSVKHDVYAKQLFAADDGSAAVLGADDVLTFYDAEGAVGARVPLLQIVPAELVSHTTAGRSWDDYLAGTFGDGVLVVDGRGVEPLAFTPDGARVSANADAILRARAVASLTASVEPLRERNEGWQEPWVCVAIGWARVAARLQVRADALDELAALPLRIHAYTSAGLRAKRSEDDPILLDRWALDPLRQAVHLARLRLGIESSLTTLMIGRKGRMLSTDWLETERPDGWTEGLASIEKGTTPSGVVADHGTPTHVDSHDQITWSYAWLREGQPVSTNLTWGDRGVAGVETVPLPPPTPRGLVA